MKNIHKYDYRDGYNSDRMEYTIPCIFLLNELDGVTDGR